MARRSRTLLLAVLVLVPVLAAPAAARPLLGPEAAPPGTCIHPTQGTELYGPTDVNAETSNGHLAVGVSRTGTITVLRWPSPSFYDQVKHHATDRSAPRMGAAPNEGILLGVAVRAHGAEPWHVSWLRGWPSEQTFAPGWSDEVVTTYRNRSLGLSVEVRDVVAAPGSDVLQRRVRVTATGSAPVPDLRLLAFENLNLVVSKDRYVPVQGWCHEGLNRDTAWYAPRDDAIVHAKAGTDASTGRQRSVAAAFAFRNGSSGHQVGGDAYEPVAAPAGRVAGPTQDAYLDAADGVLRGNDLYRGQTTGALARDLPWTGRTARGTVLLAFAPTPSGALAQLRNVREHPPAQVALAKRLWLAELLGNAPLPNATAPDAVRALARRALVTLVDDRDPATGAIVASIATQSPYGEDWIRDGAYLNAALDVAGLHRWVDQRERWYAGLQSGSPSAPTGADALVPPGSWAMNYYADGIPGGPIPWEIDETGYGAWTLWHHPNVTGDPRTLPGVYPAIRRAASFLAACRDPRNGLQCYANEDDNPQPSQTIVGAATSWMGLDAAAQAARASNHPGDAARFAASRDALGQAIDANLWNATTHSYGPAHPGLAEVAWPVCYRPATPGRFQAQLRAIWNATAPTFAGQRDHGQYEAKGLLALAHWWKGNATRMGEVRRGIAWIAGVEATPGTHVLGESWVREDGNVTTIVAEPHAWEQVLVYLASLEAWPPAGYAHVPAGCRGVTGALAAEPGAPHDEPAMRAAMATGSHVGLTGGA